MNHFYDGMSPSMKQLLETMCGGDFLSKNPDEAMDFLNYVAETSKGSDEPNPREVERMKPTANSRAGIYALTEEVELKAKLSTLTEGWKNWSRETTRRYGQWLRQLCLANHALISNLPVIKGSIVQFLTE